MYKRIGLSFTHDKAKVLYAAHVSLKVFKVL